MLVQRCAYCAPSICTHRHLTTKGLDQKQATVDAFLIKFCGCKTPSRTHQVAHGERRVWQGVPVCGVADSAAQRRTSQARHILGCTIAAAADVQVRDERRLLGLPPEGHLLDWGRPCRADGGGLCRTASGLDAGRLTGGGCPLMLWRSAAALSCWQAHIRARGRARTW